MVQLAGARVDEVEAIGAYVGEDMQGEKKRAQVQGGWGSWEFCTCGELALGVCRLLWW